MSDVDTLWRKLEALHGLYATLDLRAPLPPLGDWAIDPLMAVLLVNSVIDRQPSLIVECGGGSSTVVAAAALRRYVPAGRVLALEADGDYAQVARRHVARQGLQDIAEVRHAPLVHGAHGEWYDIEGFEDVSGPIDLLMVDGPSTAGGGPLARSPALPAMYDRLATDAWILVDDAFRDGEQEMLRGWHDLAPDITWDMHWTQCGAALGMRVAS